MNGLTIRSVRQACAYVPQDNFLFSDTIERNIAFGADRTDLKSIVHAARMADVDGNISEFKEGYQTVLGERGVTVSGGQKQRISIARALMKDAPILILDDSVSAVDTKTDALIRAAFLKEIPGTTKIIIGHRISAVCHADEILILEGGQIVERGTHDELLAKKGHYYQTFVAQYGTPESEVIA